MLFSCIPTAGMTGDRCPLLNLLSAASDERAPVVNDNIIIEGKSSGFSVKFISRFNAL